MNVAPKYRGKYPPEIVASILRFGTFKTRIQNITHRVLVPLFTESMRLNCQARSDNFTDLVHRFYPTSYPLMSENCRILENPYWRAFLLPISLVAPILLESNNRDEDLQFAFNHSVRALEHPNHLAVAALLLKSGRVNPALCIHPRLSNNHAILTACRRRGNVKFIKLLLADKRVDPTADKSRVLVSAAVNDDRALAKLLLADGRADPTASQYLAIGAAAVRNHLEVLKFFLSDPRVHLTDLSDNVINKAVRLGVINKKFNRSRSKRKSDQVIAQHILEMYFPSKRRKL